MKEENVISEYSCSGHKGFQMTFKNGYTVSVQWGDVNYCSNRNKGDSDVCSNAEVAIKKPNGNWLDFSIFGEGHISEGWLTTDEVVKYIVLAQSLD